MPRRTTALRSISAAIFVSLGLVIAFTLLFPARPQQRKAAVAPEAESGVLAAFSPQRMAPTSVGNQDPVIRMDLVTVFVEFDTEDAPAALPVPEPTADQPPVAEPTSQAVSQATVAEPTAALSAVPQVAVTPPPPPSPTATVAAPPVALTAMEQQLFAGQNSERARGGLKLLQLDAALEAVARRRAQDMASRGYFSHTSPTGETAFSLMDGAGIYAPYAAENIGYNNYPDSTSVSAVLSAFMNSPAHRANILSGNYSRVGVAVAFGANGNKYYSVIFAGP
jgi:uncharacterized protein YkwD